MEFYTMKDLQDILKIGKKQAEALMRMESFPSIKIGSSWRISQEKFNKWLDSTKSIRLDYRGISKPIGNRGKEAY